MPPHAPTTSRLPNSSKILEMRNGLGNSSSHLRQAGERRSHDDHRRRHFTASKTKDSHAYHLQTRDRHRSCRSACGRNGEPIVRCITIVSCRCDHDDPASCGSRCRSPRLCPHRLRPLLWLCLEWRSSVQQQCLSGSLLWDLLGRLGAVLNHLATKRSR